MSLSLYLINLNNHIFSKDQVLANLANCSKETTDRLEAEKKVFEEEEAKAKAIDDAKRTLMRMKPKLGSVL